MLPHFKVVITGHGSRPLTFLHEEYEAARKSYEANVSELAVSYATLTYKSHTVKIALLMPNGQTHFKIKFSNSKID